jgi:hypothetical protein
MGGKGGAYAADRPPGAAAPPEVAFSADAGKPEVAAHDQNIKVFARVRPTNDSEKRGGHEMCVEVSAPCEVRVKGESFTFDKVFGMEASQKEIYDAVAKPTVLSVFQGFNGTVFAYGQTASGKTHTMEGVLASAEEQGVIPRIVAAIFDGIFAADDSIEFVIRVSMFEIYNEVIKDLLNPDHSGLKIREDVRSGVYIEDLTELSMGSEEDIYDVFQAGREHRSTGKTDMNAHSSRSHLDFVLTLEQKSMHTKSTKVGKLHLVDLAGSEKHVKTGTTGKRLDEGIAINLSLSTLGLVINALTTKNRGHVPYRDSKLTRVLQESLGGNAKTSLIVTASPSGFNREETLSTLRFGQRAKMIKNAAKVNTELSIDEMKIVLERKNLALADAQKRISGLEQLLQSKGIQVPKSLKGLAGDEAAEGAIKADQLLEEVQRLREKLKESAENISELFRIREATEAESQRLLQEAVSLKEEKEQTEGQLRLKAEDLEGLQKAFAILQDCSASGAGPDGVPRPMSSNGSGAGAAADLLNSNLDDSPTKSIKQKVIKMEAYVTSLTSMYKTLLDQKSKSDKELQRGARRSGRLEGELKEAKQKYDRLLEVCERLSHSMNRPRRPHARTAPMPMSEDVGEQQPASDPDGPSAGGAASPSATGGAAVIPPSRIAPLAQRRKSVIVKPLRGGVSFRPDAEDDEASP